MRGYSDTRIQEMADAKATADSFAAGRPDLPADLSPQERAVWESVADELQERGTLTPADGASIALYAQTFCTHRAERDLLEKEGRVIVVSKLDKHKDAILVHSVNPRVRIVSDLEKRLLALLKQLGMTPATRTARQATIPEKQNPQSALTELDKLMARFDKQGAA